MSLFVSHILAYNQLTLVRRYQLIMASRDANMEVKTGNQFIKHLDECECHPVTAGMKYGGFHIKCIRPFVPHIYRFKNTDCNEINKHLLYTWQACKEKVGLIDEVVWVIKCLHSPCGSSGAIEDHSQYWSRMSSRNWKIC